ncbi:MAG: hypothetical protein J1F25_07670 [Prevotellaceae bacterium]|nr:hypothetical protein [Prevotellaceae bacterium]
MELRKIFVLTAIAVAIGTSVSAQDMTETDSLRHIMEQQQERLDALEAADKERAGNEAMDKIWKQKKRIGIGIGSQKTRNLDDKSEPAFKSSLALSLQSTRTIFLHKKPIANIMKIGLDWGVNLSFAKYKSLSEKDFAEDWGDQDGFYDDYYGDYDDDDYLGDMISDLGYYHFEGGLAIGPSVQVTPFYSVGKGWEHLKAYTYFHVIPSYAGLLLSGDGDTELGSAYVTNFSWGIGVSYRFISIGFETKWGSGKYNTSAFNDDFDDDVFDDGLGAIFQNDKTKYKTTSSKFIISFCF